MKSLIAKTVSALTLISLITTSVFADSTSNECSVVLTKKGLTEKQNTILENELVKKGYTITEETNYSKYQLTVNSVSKNRFDSSWFVSGLLTVKDHATIKDGTYGYSADDLHVVLPMHMITFAVGTLFKTKGSIAMKGMLKDFPSCETLENGKLAE